MKQSLVQPKNTRGDRVVDLKFILTFYDAYIRNKSLKAVSRSLEMDYSTLLAKIAKEPQLQEAKEIADYYRNKGILKDFIIAHLSPEVRDLWNQLQGMNTVQEVEALFKGYPKRIRQQIFCQALVSCGFDVSAALRKTSINYETLKDWKNDFQFLQLLEEVHFHKKNFFENGLLDLVSEGHPGAVIFANRTQNRDRGYGESLEVTDGTTGRSTNFDISELDLPVNVQKMILEAIEKKKAETEQNVGRKPAPAMKQLPSRLDPKPKPLHRPTPVEISDDDATEEEE